MRLRIFAIAIFGLHPFFLSGQGVTFHADVAPIVFNHCTSCHRPGEIGPMPFTNYAEVAAYGEFIEYVTSIGYMPPWSPDETYSHFVGENVLTPANWQH